MYSLTFTTKFKKDFKLCEKRGFLIEKIENVFEILAKSGNLPQNYKPHKLTGNYTDCWECHIEPDWLLIWKFSSDFNIILIRTGTHSDLF
jgi:mRNA interferase YafQ